MRRIVPYALLLVLLLSLSALAGGFHRAAARREMRQAARYGAGGGCYSVTVAIPVQAGCYSASVAVPVLGGGCYSSPVAAGCYSAAAGCYSASYSADPIYSTVVSEARIVAPLNLPVMVGGVYFP